METIGTITAVEIQKKNKSRVSITVDGEYLGSVEDIIWVRSALKNGDMLTAAAWEDMLGRQETQSAMDKALHYLASRARGKVEMERYLKEKGFANEPIAAAMDKLNTLGYLNDSEYASMLVRDRSTLKASGRRVIAMELKQQGIDDETAAEALEQYGDEDELEAARKHAQKALRGASRENDPKKQRAKLYSSLARRGFSSQLIHKVITELFSAETDNTES